MRMIFKTCATEGDESPNDDPRKKWAADDACGKVFAATPVRGCASCVTHHAPFDPRLFAGRGDDCVGHFLHGGICDSGPDVECTPERTAVAEQERCGCRSSRGPIPLSDEQAGRGGSVR